MNYALILRGYELTRPSYVCIMVMLATDTLSRLGAIMFCSETVMCEAAAIETFLFLFPPKESADREAVTSFVRGLCRWRQGTQEERVWSSSAALARTKLRFDCGHHFSCRDLALLGQLTDQPSLTRELFIEVLETLFCPRDAAEGQHIEAFAVSVFDTWTDLSDLVLWQLLAAGVRQHLQMVEIGSCADLARLAGALGDASERLQMSADRHGQMLRAT
jgi:hypothetical protein